MGDLPHELHDLLNGEPLTVLEAGGAEVPDRGRVSLGPAARCQAACERDFNFSKTRAGQLKRTVETSLACASDIVLESN